MSEDDLYVDPVIDGVVRVGMWTASQLRETYRVEGDGSGGLRPVGNFTVDCPICGQSDLSPDALETLGMCVDCLNDPNTP